jgi:hypothetical protein
VLTFSRTHGGGDGENNLSSVMEPGYNYDEELQEAKEG